MLSNQIKVFYSNKHQKRDRVDPEYCIEIVVTSNCQNFYTTLTKTKVLYLKRGMIDLVSYIYIPN